MAKSGVCHHEVLFLLFQAAAFTSLSFRVRMFRMNGPQCNNIRKILTDGRYSALDAFYLVGTEATEIKTLVSCLFIGERRTGKETVTCNLLWMGPMVLRSGCRKSKVGEILVYARLK